MPVSLRRAFLAPTFAIALSGLTGLAHAHATEVPYAAAITESVSVSVEGEGEDRRPSALSAADRLSYTTAFDALRRQAAYKAALDRGAVELWMPALEPQSLALQIEQQRLQFHQARDGDVPAGRNASYISALERVMIREWMTRMDEEFAAVDTWLPWATS